MAAETATASWFGTMFDAVKGPAIFSVVGQGIGYAINAGEKSRQQTMLDLITEDKFKDKIDTLDAQQALDKFNFDENSIPIGENGEEVHISGDHLVYYCDDKYHVFNLNQNFFKPMYFSETKENNKLLSTVISVFTDISRSAFLSNKQKDKLRATIDRYNKACWVNHDSANWVTGLFRMVSRDYTRQEFEDIYKDYKAGKNKKTGNYASYFFGSRHRDKNRYIDIAEAFDEMRKELEISLNEIKVNLNHIKGKCIEKLKTMNVFEEKRKSEFLTRVTKSKVLLQRLYLEYKNNGENFDNAIFKVACELYHQNSLNRDTSLLTNEQIQGIRSAEKRNIRHTSDHEVEEQVRRYFNFSPDIVKFAKTKTREISIDKYSKIIEINEHGNGIYYLDFNQLKNDISDNGGCLYYNLLLETLKQLAEENKYALHAKYAKVMQYIEDTVTKMKNKSFKDDEYEYLPNMLFHWISSLTNGPILEQDLGKKIVTVTFMDADNKDRPHDDTDKDNEEIYNFQNISFDIFDPKTKRMKMGTIIRKGEKIYYKEDPGLEDFKVISAEELLTRLDVRTDKDIEEQYTGDCWRMRKMLYFIQQLSDKERQEKVNAEQENKLIASSISNDILEDEKEYSPAIVNAEKDLTEPDIQVKNISNSMPINTLTERSAVINDNNDENDTSIHHNEETKTNFTGNANCNISYKIPSINLHMKNEILSPSTGQ